MRDAKPEGRDACTQGSAAEAKEKRRVRWLRKGLAAVGKRSGSDHAIPKVVIGPPIPVMPSLKDHEIRLVHINPSTGPEGMIHCNLVTVNLEESPQFEALSYEWGPALPNVQIMMNGRSVSVRENLWWALRHLQLEDSRRVIWIDALCINQQDMAERNHQVAQMARFTGRRLVVLRGLAGSESSTSQHLKSMTVSQPWSLSRSARINLVRRGRITRKVSRHKAGKNTIVWSFSVGAGIGADCGSSKKSYFRQL
jgi:hypothetical protein